MRRRAKMRSRKGADPYCLSYLSARSDVIYGFAAGSRLKSVPQ